MKIVKMMMSLTCLVTVFFVGMTSTVESSCIVGSFINRSTNTYFFTAATSCAVSTVPTPAEANSAGVIWFGSNSCCVLWVNIDGTLCEIGDTCILPTGDTLNVLPCGFTID